MEFADDIQAGCTESSSRLIQDSPLTLSGLRDEKLGWPLLRVLPSALLLPLLGMTRHFWYARHLADLLFKRLGAGEGNRTLVFRKS
jgi:hypothetical protein